MTNPGIVQEIHREYVRSGADIIKTNTFGANRFKLRKYGLNDNVADGVFVVSVEVVLGAGVFLG